MRKQRLYTKTLALILIIGIAIMHFPFKSFEHQVFAEEIQRSYFSEDNDEDAVQSTSLNSETEYLLYGYDVTSGIDIMDMEVSQNPIIDRNSGYIEKYVKKHTKTKQLVYTDENSNREEIMNQFINDSYGKVYGQIYVVDANLFSSFKESDRIKNAYSEKFEYYSLSRQKHYYIVEADLNEIRECLTEKFKKALNSVKTMNDAKNLLKDFGTHLNTGYRFGGRMDMTCYKSTSEVTTDLNRSSSLSAKANVILMNNSIGSDIGSSSEIDSQETEGNSNSKYRLTVYGGDSIQGLSSEDVNRFSDSFLGSKNAGYMYSEWLRSLDSNSNLSIIGIPSTAKAIPVWELLDSNLGLEKSKEIRGLLIDAYVELCGDKYEKYLNEYPALVRKDYSLIDTDGKVWPTFNGIYIKTPNDYCYFVDSDDLISKGDHNVINPYTTVYLDLVADDITLLNLDYDCNGGLCIDENKGIFKVTETTGNFTITVRIGTEENTILNLPIKTSDFEGGTGKEAYPYIILNDTQFEKISSNPSAHYILYRDIDFNGKSIDSIDYFSGVLDGNYCTIKNLVINPNSKWGLIGVNAGKISNLAIVESGSSINEQGFISGGTDYNNDYVNDEYKKNTISAMSAGIICGENRGEITNCLVSNCYIRNIVTKEKASIVNSSVCICAGAISGVNEGKVSECMVKDSRIMSSFVNTDEDNISIEVYSGGLLGKASKNSSVENCVVDMSSNGTVLSQGINNYKDNEEDSIIKIFSAGLIGCCNDGTELRNTYVSVKQTSANSSYKCVDAVYTLLTDKLEIGGADTPKVYQCLRSATMVCSDRFEMPSSNNFFSCEDSSEKNKLEGNSIYPIKNGDNRESTKVYTPNTIFTERKIMSESDYLDIIKDSNMIIYNRNNKKLVHRLSTSRSEYIQVELNQDRSKVQKEYFINNHYIPKGVVLKRSILGSEDYQDVKIFLVKLTGNVKAENGSVVKKDNLIFKELQPDNEYIHNYIAEYKLYGDEKRNNCDISISVLDDQPIGLYIDDEECNKYFAFYDDIDSYFNSLSVDDIDLYKVMASGEKVRIKSDDSDIDAVNIENVKSDIKLGTNYVTVSYMLGKKYNFTTNYILNVKSRELKSIKILNNPSKTEYESGDTIDLRGMKLELTFEDDSKKIIDDKYEIDRLEFVGDNYAEGTQTIQVFYRGYSKYDTFNISVVPRNAETSHTQYTTDEAYLCLSDSNNPITINIDEEKSISLSASILPYEYYAGKIYWKVSDENIVLLSDTSSLSGGSINITAVNEGEVTLTVCVDDAAIKDISVVIKIVKNTNSLPIILGIIGVLIIIILIVVARKQKIKHDNLHTDENKFDIEKTANSDEKNQSENDGSSEEAL